MQDLKRLMQTAECRWASDLTVDHLPLPALSRARNALRYIESAHLNADDNPALSFFCLSHANEEAVTCLVKTLAVDAHVKIKGYQEKNHLHKAVVSYLAERLAEHLSRLDAVYRLVSDEDRIRVTSGAQHEDALRRYWSEDGLPASQYSPTHRVLMDSFFADEPSEHAYIKNNSKSRDRALYSYDEGPPTIPRDNLRENALHYAKVTVGMIVFATEVHRGFVSPPLVQQLAADAGWLIERLRPQSKTRPASGET